jgi:UMF1 family MFS transporter
MKRLQQWLRQPANAWAMYDWANSAFATTILATVLPIYYASVAGANLPGNTATVYWGYTNSIALLLTALISPILGAIADERGRKKRFLQIFAILGISGTALLYFVKTGDWLLASLFFILGTFGFAGANVFYDALLPSIVEPEDIEEVSARGFAMGYLGGGLLLAINLLMISAAGEGGSEQATRWVFVSVSVWWLIFMLPIMRYVAEPKSAQANLAESAVLIALRRLARTARELPRYRDLLVFLVAFWFYSDGIGTIIKMGVIFGAELGIGQTHLIGTLLAVQFIGVPFSLAFGYLGRRWGAKQAIYLGLVVYIFTSIGAFFMQTALHFWLLGMGIAIAQGGVQALTRALGARMVPADRTAEFFGFFSASIKFAGILGPFLFALIAQQLGETRYGILVVVAFFVIGLLILTRVNVERGVEAASIGLD